MRRHLRNFYLAQDPTRAALVTGPPRFTRAERRKQAAYLQRHNLSEERYQELVTFDLMTKPKLLLNWLKRH